MSLTPMTKVCVSSPAANERLSGTCITSAASPVAVMGTTAADFVSLRDTVSSILSSSGVRVNDVLLLLSK